METAIWIFRAEQSPMRFWVGFFFGGGLVFFFRLVSNSDFIYKLRRFFFLPILTFRLGSRSNWIFWPNFSERKIYRRNLGKLGSYPVCPIQSKDWKPDLLYNGDYQVEKS